MHNIPMTIAEPFLFERNGVVRASDEASLQYNLRGNSNKTTLPLSSRDIIHVSNDS